MSALEEMRMRDGSSMRGNGSEGSLSVSGISGVSGVSGVSNTPTASTGTGGGSGGVRKAVRFDFVDVKAGVGEELGRRGEVEVVA